MENKERFSPGKALEILYDNCEKTAKINECMAILKVMMEEYDDMKRILSLVREASKNMTFKTMQHLGCYKVIYPRIEKPFYLALPPQVYGALNKFLNGEYI